MTNLQEELATLQEEYSALKTAKLKADNRIAELEQRNLELEHQVAHGAKETVRFHCGIKFRKGPETGNQWMPFCPKCGLPVNDVFMADRVSRWALCSAHCGWTGQKIEKPIADIVAEFDSA